LEEGSQRSFVVLLTAAAGGGVEHCLGRIEDGADLAVLLAGAPIIVTLSLRGRVVDSRQGWAGEGAVRRETKRYLLDRELEQARKLLRRYLDHHQASPLRNGVEELLSRLERHERIVNEVEQQLIELAEKEA
jgi:hypothetical protein